MQSYFSVPYAWLPPASDAQLEAAAQVMEMQWPENVRALYLVHEGTAPERLADDWQDHWQAQLDHDEDATPQGPYLMTLDEATAWYTDTQGLFPDDVRFFWTDDNSNYVGLYIQGPLQGMVCVLSHDGGSFVPTFRHLQDFLAWVSEHPSEDIFDDSTYVPAFPVAGSDPSHDEADWERAQALFATADESEDNPRLACAMSLTPYGHSDVLLPYLDHADFYVVERAVDILALRRFERAYKRIEGLAGDQHNSSNGAARRAIAGWQRD